MKHSSWTVTFMATALVLLASNVTAFAVPTVIAGFGIEKFVDIGEPVGIAFDQFGNLYVGNDPPGGGASEPARIRRISADGSVISEVGGLIPDPDKVIVDIHGVVTDAGNVIVSAAGSLVSVNPGTGQTTTLFSGSPFNNANQAVFDGNRLIVGQLGPDLVQVQGGVATVLASFPGHQVAGVTLGDATLYVGLRDTGEVFRLDASNNPHLLGDIDSNLNTMAFGSLGTFVDMLYVGNHVSGVGGTLYAMNPQTGATTVLATGFNAVSHFEFAPNGDLYVSDENTDEIWRIFAVNQSAAAVPEPVTATSLIMAGAVMLIRRRKVN